MKKVLAIVLAMLMICALAACTPEAPVEGTDEPENTAPSVCLIVGNASDKSFSESAARGMTLLTETYGCVTKVIEYGSDETKLYPTLEDVSGDEWDIVVTIGYNNLENIQTLAAQFPDQKYVLLDQRVGEGFSNVYSADYKGNEGAFLSGALAAMVTTASTEEMPFANEDKVVGFVGGMDMTLINDFTLGFIQGAQEIDPEVKVITSYTNDFSDAAKGKELAAVMFQSGCDLVYNGAGAAGLGCLEAGKEAGKYSIGTDSDQAVLFESDPEKANLILTSQLKSLDVHLVQLIGRYLDGEEVFGLNETLGVKEGVICLSDNDYYKTNVPQWMRDKIVELEAGIKDGSIVVQSAYGMETEAVAEIINGARP